jgi:hypothetical protein
MRIEMFLHFYRKRWLHLVFGLARRSFHQQSRTNRRRLGLRVTGRDRGSHHYVDSKIHRHSHIYTRGRVVGYSRLNVRSIRNEHVLRMNDHGRRRLRSSWGWRRLRSIGRPNLGHSIRRRGRRRGLHNGWCRTCLWSIGSPNDGHFPRSIRVLHIGWRSTKLLRSGRHVRFGSPG